jgi:hypothetical protein
MNCAGVSDIMAILCDKVGKCNLYEGRETAIMSSKFKKFLLCLMYKSGNSTGLRMFEN